MRALSTEQTSPILAKGLNVDIDKLAASQGANEHNVREAWDALCRSTSEFTTKYAAEAKTQ